MITALFIIIGLILAVAVVHTIRSESRNSRRASGSTYYTPLERRPPTQEPSATPNQSLSAPKKISPDERP